MLPPTQLVHSLGIKLRKHKLLERIYNLFLQQHLIPKIGVEIEFFLNKNGNVKSLETQLGLKITKEKGVNQYELELPATTDICSIPQNINHVKCRLKEQTLNQVLFEAKPYHDDYGNSMHFHVNFLRKTHNYFSDIKKISNAAESVCHYMLSTFLIFAPQKRDYDRFDKKFLAPTHVCFGNNNRTVAVRIPDKYPRRLEHRLSNPLTDPYLALFVILKSIYLGFIRNESQKSTFYKVYGNAFDPQYNLDSLPKDLHSAYQTFDYKFLSL